MERCKYSWRSPSAFIRVGVSCSGALSDERKQREALCHAHVEGEGKDKRESLSRVLGDFQNFCGGCTLVRRGEEKKENGRGVAFSRKGSSLVGAAAVLHLKTRKSAVENREQLKKNGKERGDMTI